MWQYNPLPAATEFADMPVKDPYPEGGLTEMCQRCHGHGGWVLLLNEYGPGDHFMAICGVCWGWGWRRPGETCLHEWEVYQNVGNCLNEWKCKICGTITTVDSSD